ncbi:MAG: hypothetical protein OEN21_13080, partial [Myxococcales bacterium]|nr:hypothetical protein [Myxococcales bacterium]
KVEWAIGILLLGVVLEGYSFHTAIRESRAVKGPASWWEFIRHSRTPELPVVLLEDFGALMGLTLALLGISIAAITGDSRWDAYGTISIGVLLVVIAAVLVFEMKSLLIGESALGSMRKTIVRAIEETPDVNRLLHMRTQHIGPDELLVAAKIQLKPGLTTARVAAAINQTENRIRNAVPIGCMIYLEPDVFDPDHPDLAQG